MLQKQTTDGFNHLSLTMEPLCPWMCVPGFFFLLLFLFLSVYLDFVVRNVLLDFLMLI